MKEDEKLDSYSEYLKKVNGRKLQLRVKLQILLNTNLGFKILEIGSGHGDFLVSYANMNKAHFCIGIDIITNRVEKSLKKAKKCGLENCFFIKAKAEEFIECQPTDVLWNEIFILYPDPWPKKRHHKNRLLNYDFLSKLINVVAPNAKIHFETDYKQYFDNVCEMVTNHPNWIKCNKDKEYIVDTYFSRITGDVSYSAIFICKK